MATGFIVGGLTHLPTFVSSKVTDISAQGFVLGLLPKQDVGYVTSSTFIVLYLWNGTVNDAIITGMSKDEGAEGILWDIDVPMVAPLLESVRVVIEVTIDGPLVIDGNITLTSSCRTIVFNITGTRAPHLSGDIGYIFAPHNWANGFNEKIEWKTDLMIAFDGTEQRMKMRNVPRRSFEYSFLLEGNYRRKVEGYFSMRNTRYLFVPIWRDVIQLKTTIEPGTSIVYLDYVSDSMAVGTPLAVFKDENTFEIRNIHGVGIGFIIMDAPFELLWEEKFSLVAPCRNCIATNKSVTRVTDLASELRTSLRVINDKWNTLPYDLPTFEDITICPSEPSFEPESESLENKWVLLDNDIGVISYDMQSKEPIFSRQVKFTLFGKDNIYKFLEFLKVASGKLVPFWVASTDFSFELAYNVSSDDSFIVIKDIGFNFQFSGSICRSVFQILKKDGTIIRSRISAVETQPNGDEKISLNSSIGHNILLSEVLQCSWFEKVRFDSDEINIEWVTDESAIVKTSIVVLNQ